MEFSIVSREAPEALDQIALHQAGPAPLMVLKFGSSVLKTVDDLPAIAGEIYRHRRRGYRVIAIVSALSGETDALIAEAKRAAGGLDCRGFADLISLGEERAVALLRISCERIGLPVATCRAEDIELGAEGSELDADFIGLNPTKLLARLDGHGVVIVPGFVGTAADGGRRLLGRGGSDFTAAILGGELGAECVRLYKDVDGVFEQDPAIAPGARKFDEVSYSDALTLARQLVHEKAVEFAAERSVPIEVEALGSRRPTRIGHRSKLATVSTARPPLRIALAGYGVVGQALSARLKHDPHFEIVSILVRDTERQRDISPPIPLTNSIDRFLGAEADAVVELLSCERTAERICCEKLRDGIDVVTASKRLVSSCHKELNRSAELGQAQLLYSASVGGSVPLLEAIARLGRQREIVQVSGVLNGTVNFVLEQIHAGSSLNAAIAEARIRGFAEEDCEADLSGADAAAKLKIIASNAFAVEPTGVRVTTELLDQAAEQIIRQSGERWIQLASVKRGPSGVEGTVLLCPRRDTGLPDARGEWNVGHIRFANGSELCLTGRGAGGPATAEAVLSDLYDLLLGREAEVVPPIDLSIARLAAE